MGRRGGRRRRRLQLSVREHDCGRERAAVAAVVPNEQA